MTPDRWAQVERLYHAALLHQVSERSAFLRDACAEDEALRSDVESLLAQTASLELATSPAIAVAADLVSTPERSVMSGRRFGVYQILGLLGAGGMGDVYRARDTKLGRDVAIKVLPRDFASQPDRLARFQREARVLATLNHPHIGAIYGVEDAGGVPALVLELIEGATLAERIARGPIPLDEAIPIAKQIAAALEAAHDQGVIHRDLKPANIKLRGDGTVKVLDFGLAKAAGIAGAPELTQSPTVTVGGTREGVIVGTAAYMSPEQARGQAVDKRTDIWAFGCVVYEMVTGGLAFSGATFSDTLAAVLEREPDWQRLPPSTPTSVRQLLRRCLAKPVGRRLRDIGDALLELETLGADGRAADSASTNAAPRLRRIQPGTVAMLAITAIAVIAAGTAWWTRPAAVAPTILGPMTRLTSDSGLTTEPSISADGRLVAYASNRSGEANLDVYVQQTSGGAAIRLTSDAADDRSPTVSPDGSLVAFRSDRIPSGIYLSPALGGSARLIAPQGRAPRFSPDGRFLAYWTGPWLAARGVGASRQVFIVAATGGSPERFATDVSNPGDPVWAPDGQSLLVFGRDAGNEPDWWWVPRSGGKSVKTGAFARFAAQQLNVSDDLFGIPQAWDERGVLFSAADRTGDARGLWRIAINQTSGRVSGEAVRLTHGTTNDVWPSVSKEHRVVFAAQSENQLIFGLPLDVDAGKVTGAIRRLRDDTAETGRASLSEDGRLMVFPKYEFASGGVWARDLTTGREWQLAVTPRTPLNPVITVDGEWTAYTVSKVDTGGNGGPGDGYVVKTSGDAPRRVCEDCQLDQWTRDGHFTILAESGRRRVSRLELATGNRIPLLDGEEFFDRLLFGPDGRWMVFNVPEHVYVAPIHPDRASPKAEWTSIVSKPRGAGRSAGLSPDGSLLYLLLETDGFRCLYGLRLDPNTGQARGTPFLIAHFHDAARSWGSTGLGSAAVKGLFVADLFETTSNIWMASYVDAGK